MPGFDMMGAGMLGLGLAGDVFGGLSAYNQANRQRQQYNYSRQFQDPNWVLSQSQPYINRLNATLQQQTPQIMRTSVNPFLGSHGIDPNSGAGQSIYAQALAPYIMQNNQEGMNQFLTAAGQGSQYGTQNIGQVYGSGNNLSNALRSMYMAGAGQPRQQAGQVNEATPYTGDSGLGGLAQYTSAPMSGSATPWESMFMPGSGRNMTTPGSNWGNFGVGF